MYLGEMPTEHSVGELESLGLCLLLMGVGKEIEHVGASSGQEG